MSRNPHEKGAGDLDPFFPGAEGAAGGSQDWSWALNSGLSDSGPAAAPLYWDSPSSDPDCGQSPPPCPGEGLLDLSGPAGR